MHRRTRAANATGSRLLPSASLGQCARTSTRYRPGATLWWHRAHLHPTATLANSWGRRSNTAGAWQELARSDRHRAASAASAASGRPMWASAGRVGPAASMMWWAASCCKSASSPPGCGLSAGPGAARLGPDLILVDDPNPSDALPHPHGRARMVWSTPIGHDGHRKRAPPTCIWHIFYHLARGPVEAGARGSHAAGARVGSGLARQPPRPLSQPVPRPLG